jgi:hypothetical protein
MIMEMSNHMRWHTRARLSLIAIVCSVLLPSVWLAKNFQTASAGESTTRLRTVTDPIKQNAQSNVDINRYLASLRPKLMHNWLLPDGKNLVVLTTLINADGTSTNVTMTSQPNNEAAEQAANDSFSKILPLPPLPPHLKAAKLTLNFQSNADPHGDSQSNLTMNLDPLPANTAELK